MARVVVVGGGFGGMASAARLARLGHQVTLLEASARLGGALAGETGGEGGGFGWDTGPSSTALPAVLRDLFRKTGRPLEKELELVPTAPREHRFPDGSRVRLPGGSRAAGLRAVESLGAGLGQAWVAYVDTLAGDWDLLRRDYLERPWNPTTGSAEAAALLRSRRNLSGRVRRGLTDERLRALALHPVGAWGEDPRRVPAWLGVWPYVEQRFGVWAPVGGMAAVTSALEARLALRGVAVERATPVRDLVVRAGRVAGVVTGQGTVDADVVVCAVDPRTLPALAAYVARSRPAPLPALTHLGLLRPEPTGREEFPTPDPTPSEVVLHGDPVVVARSGGRAPEGRVAVTLLGPPGTDLVDLAAARGLDLRDRIVARVDHSPDALLARWGQSPLGTRWQGRRSVRRRLGPRTPLPGVYAAGAHAAPGAGLPFVGLSAALVAQVVGPA